MTIGAEDVSALQLLIAINRAHNVATHRSGGVAVAIVIHGGDNRIFNATDMAQSTIEGNRPSLFSGPPFAEFSNVFGIRGTIAHKRHRFSGERGKNLLVILIFTRINICEGVDGVINYR